ncbi:peroxidase [Favolaschia claudopus]|uniref:Peroxidase n=1 Tax=Favolaschia claudopus TaxID=2862362 RepID=A0AAW0D404_9AGAR
MFPPLALLLSYYTATVSAAVHTWPSPKLDALEAQRWDQDDTINGFSSFVQPCTFFIRGNDDGSETGRANGPDWIRTAYHDMATHNSEDGTGGLDASIRFAEEQSRPENAGTGFQNTLDVFVAFTTRHVSLADLIAIGLVTAVENCGGPQIDFRGGRIDAAEPNAPGVPEPQGDLNAHIASFKKQGFTQTEMIGLVACGHSFGGVEHKPFPEIVPELNEPNNTLSVQHFDTTFDFFDNKVATEYIAGTSQNPLLVGANDTTNSDKRIFASDGNKTMASFADSSELFASTCASLFARMLDTVPKDVQLSDVIDPLPIKPSEVQIVLGTNGKLLLSGVVRLFNVTVDDPGRTVQLLIDSHSGETTTTTLALDRFSSAMGGRVQSPFYAFNQSQDPDGNHVGVIELDPAKGVEKMRFNINGKVEDQGGVGFKVQDGVVFSETSCITTVGATEDDDPVAGRFDIAVRTGLNPRRIFLEQEVKDSLNRTVVKETDLERPAQPVSAGDGAYELWSIQVNDANTYTIGAEIDDGKFSTIDTHSLKILTPCTPTKRRVWRKRRPGI